MFERFSDRARKTMALANQEAQRFNHEYIGPEHILLGLLKEGSGVGANVLKNLDVDLRKLRLDVEKLITPGPDMVTQGKLPQTPAAKAVIERAIVTARNLNHSYVGTEHLTCGLWTDDNIAGKVLQSLNLKLEEIREEILHVLGAGAETETQVAFSPQRVKEFRRTNPRAGREHVLTSLPDDIDYLQHLATEATKYITLRSQELQVPLQVPESRGEIFSAPLQMSMLSKSTHAWLSKMKITTFGDLLRTTERELRDHKSFTHEALSEVNQLLASKGLVLGGLQQDTNIIREPSVDEQNRASLSPREDSQPGSTGPRTVSLDPLSLVHLLLFRAGDAIGAQGLQDAMTLMDDAIARTRGLIQEAITQALTDLEKRIEFIRESLGSEGAARADAFLTNLRAIATGSDPLEERVRLFQRLRDDVLTLLHRKPTLVCKVNVFDHGIRDVLEVESTWTVGDLAEHLKTKHEALIEEHLFHTLKRRLRRDEIQIGVFPDSGTASSREKELASSVLLLEIPGYDSDGVIWYPGPLAADEEER